MSRTVTEIMICYGYGPPSLSDLPSNISPLLLLVSLYLHAWSNYSSQLYGMNLRDGHTSSVDDETWLVSHVSSPCCVFVASINLQVSERTWPTMDRKASEIFVLWTSNLLPGTRGVCQISKSIGLRAGDIPDSAVRMQINFIRYLTCHRSDVTPWSIQCKYYSVLRVIFSCCRRLLRRCSCDRS